MTGGKLIIFSAPSGSGKTTIVKHLLHQHERELGFSVSACTREQRSAGESNGNDYYFLTPEEFRSKVEANEFAEWEEVYPNMFYGTLKAEIERIWKMGKHVIFDVDVKGGMKLKECYGEKALSIFVKIPSMDELERRLRYRNTETEEKIQERLRKANLEMSYSLKFDKVLVNENLETALVEAEELVGSFLGFAK
jgi:guanylate kinase